MRTIVQVSRVYYAAFSDWRSPIAGIHMNATALVRMTYWKDKIEVILPQKLDIIFYLI